MKKINQYIHYLFTFFENYVYIKEIHLRKNFIKRNIVEQSIEKR